MKKNEQKFQKVQKDSIIFPELSVLPLWPGVIVSAWCWPSSCPAPSAVLGAWGSSSCLPESYPDPIGQWGGGQLGGGIVVSQCFKIFNRKYSNNNFVQKLQPKVYHINFCRKYFAGKMCVNEIFWFLFFCLLIVNRKHSHGNYVYCFYWKCLLEKVSQWDFLGLHFPFRSSTWRITIPFSGGSFAQNYALSSFDWQPNLFTWIDFSRVS